MTRKLLTRWLHDQNPRRFIVSGERQWLMAPIRPARSDVPFLLMDLRELLNPSDPTQLDSDDRPHAMMNELARRAKIPCIVVWFPRDGVDDSTQIETCLASDAAGRSPGKRVLGPGKSFRDTYFPGGGGAVKAINRTSANAFHDWQRSAFPRDVVFQDLDLIIAKDRTAAPDPVALVEHKQSFFPPKTWNAADYMRRDAPNYRALLRFAEAVGITAAALYQVKDRPITPMTEIGAFRITSVGAGQVTRSATYPTAGNFAADPMSFL